MARIIEISDLNDERLSVYTSLCDRSLRSAIQSGSQSGVFIAESPKVIHAALDTDHIPVSMICENKHLAGDAKSILERLPEDIPVFTGPRELLATLTGYTLTRGVLCAMHRPVQPSLKEIAANARLLAVVDNVSDSTNIGSIFRAAAALGIDGIVMSGGSCDPLNRRSIRVSMGTVFRVPWCTISEDPSVLQAYGFKTAALALKPNSIPLSDERLKGVSKLAVLLGSEGDGLHDETIEKADYKVIIPMHNNVDSLNVATAAAIAFWQLTQNNVNK